MDILELSASELVFMASYLGAEEFYGIEDPYLAMSENETKSALAAAQLSLAEKQYASLDFDGKFSPGENLTFICGICANCDRYIAVDVMDNGVAQNPVRIFIHEGVAVRLTGTDKLMLEAIPPERIQAELFGTIEKYTPSTLKASGEPAVVPLTIFSRASSVDVKDQKNVLMAGGCPEIFADIVIGGLRRRAVYYTIILTDFIAKNVESVLCLNSEHGAMRMVPTKADDTDGWTLSHIDAKAIQAAVSAMLCGVLEHLGKEREGNASV